MYESVYESSPAGHDLSEEATLHSAGAQRRGRAWLLRHRERLLVPVVLAAGIVLWDLLVRWQQYPAFVLPSPAVVARKFGIVLADGSLLRHTTVTLTEIALGLAIGLSVALVLGYVLGKNRTADRLLSPYIVASQSVPIVAIAPLLVIWLGTGLASKVLVCALIAFFPTLISTIVGIRNVDPDLYDLMRSLRASRWQVFRMLELPGGPARHFRRPEAERDLGRGRCGRGRVCRCGSGPGLLDQPGARRPGHAAHVCRRHHPGHHCAAALSVGLAAGTCGATLAEMNHRSMTNRK